MAGGFGCVLSVVFFFFQAEDGIRDLTVTGVQTCALPISGGPGGSRRTFLRRGRPALYSIHGRGAASLLRVDNGRRFHRKRHHMAPMSGRAHSDTELRDLTTFCRTPFAYVGRFARAAFAWSRTPCKPPRSR